MTTGQPIRFPSDRNKYNNEYMESLQLQINLNQTNLEANRLYKQTGQLPASTQMMDTRSNEEKLADIHNLKQSIISDLAPIAEPMFASAVIQGVIDSPLNVDNSLFRYLAQNASTFAQTLSKKYKFGIAGDANDVAIMVQFLEDAYNKTKNSFQSIKGYINSNTNEGNKTKSNVLSANDTDNVKLEIVNVIKRFEYINHTLVEQVAPANLIGELRMTTQFLAEVNSFLPTSIQMNDVIEQLARSERVLFRIGQPLPPPADRDLLLAVLKILKTIPRGASIATLLDMCDKALDKRDYGRLQRTLNNIRQLFIQFESPENRQLLRDFRNDFLEKARIMEEDRQQRSSENLVSEMKLQNEQEAYQKNAKRVYVINPANDPVNVTSHLGINMRADFDADRDDNGPIDPSVGLPQASQMGGSQGSFNSNMSIDPRMGYGGSQVSGLSGQSNLSGIQSIASNAPIAPERIANAVFIDQEVDALNQAELDQLYTYIPMAHARVPLSPALQGMFNHPNASPAQKRYACSEALKTAAGLGGNAYDPQKNRGNFGIRGLGLNKKVKKGRGLYSPFGDSEINHKNLENNILTLRRKSKTNYMDLPSKHISKHMKNILHSIVGGKIANFEDIQNLNDEERNYLNKIIKKSNLQDRLSVPAPSKDQADRDSHQWEVMRGEIMAGNDSHELVKKFKILTMKLTRQGLLPKNEVMELFEDLVNLGY